MEHKTTISLKSDGHPIADDGSLAIPPNEYPVMLEGAIITYHLVSCREEVGSTEYFNRLDQAVSMLGDKYFPVTLAITDHKIIFHAMLHPEIFGRGYNRVQDGAIYGWLETSNDSFYTRVEAVRLSMTRDGKYRMDVYSRSIAYAIAYRVILDQRLTAYANDIIWRCGGQESFQDGDEANRRAIILN